MSDAPDFRRLLAQPVTSAEKPKPLPQGHYFGQIKDRQYDKSKNKGTPFVRLGIMVQAADTDVDQDVLAQSLHGDLGAITKKSLRKDYYLTNEALFRLRGLIESCAIDVGGNRGFDAAIEELVNKSVRFELGIRPDETGEPAYNDVGDMAGI